jgi:hypothetical protein
VLAGLLPVVAAIASVFDFLAVVDRGAAFSLRTVEILRRFRLSVGLVAGCLTLGLVGFWVAADLMHPTLVLLCAVLDAVALVAVTLAALLERILAGALALSRDVDLTV